MPIKLVLSVATIEYSKKYSCSSTFEYSSTRTGLCSDFF